MRKGVAPDTPRPDLYSEPSKIDNLMTARADRRRAGTTSDRRHR